MLIEYVKLYQEGNETLEARANILKEARELILDARRKYDTALDKLDYKIGRYEVALETGELTWE